MRPSLYRRCSGGELDRHEQPAVPGRPSAAQPPRHRHLRQLCGLHARHCDRGRAPQDDGGHARRRYSLPRLPHHLVTSLPAADRQCFVSALASVRIQIRIRQLNSTMFRLGIQASPHSKTFILFFVSNLNFFTWLLILKKLYSR